MRVGVFLDVDGVVTDKAVNLQFAQLLGVEDGLKDLEERYARAEITNDQFNAKFIPLFRNANFTETYANETFDKIQRRVNSADLLSTVQDTFLVTSGPSYYIHELAKRFGIPPGNVLCSEYQFDCDGLLERCVRPVTMAVKGHFVESRARNYDVSIGVGDTDQDFVFLAHCDVRIMMQSNRLDYLAARELQPVIGMLQKLVTAGDRSLVRYRDSLNEFYRRSPYSKNVFIMTPYRNDARFRETIRNIQDALRQKGFHGWLATDVYFEQQLWDNVKVYLSGCRAGIALFTNDDTKDHVSETGGSVFNPNISIEAGYMLAQGKPLLLLKEKKLKRLPTDMLNFLYTDFDLEDSARSIGDAVDRWIASKLI